MKHLMRELEESQQDVALLTHSLADKKAEHQIEINKNLDLERQLEKSQQNERRLETFTAGFQMTAHDLQEVAQKQHILWRMLVYRWMKPSGNLLCFLRELALHLDELNFFKVSISGSVA